MRITKKRRTFIILLSIFIFIIGFFLIRRAIRIHEKKWGDVEQTYMADFTCDGNQELLLMYSDYKKQSAMKLVCPETGRAIWRSSAFPSFIHDRKRIVVHDSILAIAFNDFRNEAPKGYGDLGVEAFSSLTGEKIWEYRYKEDYRRDELWTERYKNNIIVYVGKNIDEGILTSIDLKTGIKNWEVKIPYLSNKPPYKTNNKMVLSIFNKISVVNLDNGAAEHNVCSNKRVDVLCSDSTIYFIHSDTVLTYDTALHYAEYKNKPIILNQNDSLYRTKTAIVNKMFVSFFKYRYVFEHIEKGDIVQTNPFYGEDKVKIFRLDNNVKIADFYLNYILRNNDESAFYQMKCRYIPLLFTKDFSKDTTLKQLAVFDTKSHIFLWKSEFQKFRNTEFCWKDIFYHQGYFIFILDQSKPNKEHTDHLFFTLNGNTGKFRSSLQLKSEEFAFSTNMWPGASMFTEGYIYGTSKILFYTPRMGWAMNFPELDLKYITSNNIETNEAKQQIEKIFGAMPWETKSKEEE